MSRRALLVVALLAILARVSYEIAVRSDDGPVGALAGHLLGDERAYDEFARQVASGGLARERAFYQEPVYAWLLGQLYWVWPPEPLADLEASVVVPSAVHRAVFVVQHGLGVLLALLVASLGTRVLSPRAGLLAGVCAALSGPVIFHEAMLLKASLALVAFVSVLHLWLTVLEGRGRAPLRLALGVLLGLAALLRGNLLLLVPLVLLSVLRAPGSRPVREALLVLTGTFAALAPATLHNLALGEWVLTTYQAGSNAAIGMPAGSDPTAGVTYAPLRSGRGDALWEERDAVELAEAAVGRRLSGPEVSRYWWSVVAERVAQQPAVALQRVALKLAHLFHGREVPDVKDWEDFARRVPWLATPLSTLWLLGPMALVAFVVLPWRRAPGLFVVRSGVVVLGLSLGLFYVMGRYRLTVAPCLWILAAGLVDRWLGAARQRPGRVGAEVGATAVLVALEVLLPLPSESGGRHLTFANAASVAFQRASEATEAGDARRQRDLAVEWCRTASSIAPAFPGPRRLLVRTLALTTPVIAADSAGATEAAWRLLLLMELERSGRLDRVALVDGPGSSLRAAALQAASAPSQPGGDESTGPLLAWASRCVAQDLRSTPQDLELALSLLERADRLDPSEPLALVQRGLVLKRLGRLAEAEAAYRGALEAGVSDPELLNNLGNLLVETGRPAEAVPLLERALSLVPGDARVQRNLERALQAAGG